jgi:hypothetical protein
MSTVFDLDKIVDVGTQLNMEELYEKKQNVDKRQLDLFNKLLGKIHMRIKHISKQPSHPLILWYIVPETIIGVPRYDQAACIVYLINQLETNGFVVKYILPNLLCICWHHYIPKYVRNKIFQTTGIQVDETGTKIEPEEEEPTDDTDTDNVASLAVVTKKNKSDKSYTPLNKYKPTGNLIYNDKYLNIDK